MDSAMTKKQYLEESKRKETKADRYFDSQNYKKACKSLEFSISYREKIKEPNPELFFKLANAKLMLNDQERATKEFCNYLEAAKPTPINRIQRAKAHFFKVIKAYTDHDFELTTQMIINLSHDLQFSPAKLSDDRFINLFESLKILIPPEKNKLDHILNSYTSFKIFLPKQKLNELDQIVEGFYSRANEFTRLGLDGNFGFFLTEFRKDLKILKSFLLSSKIPWDLIGIFERLIDDFTLPYKMERIQLILNKVRFIFIENVVKPYQVMKEFLCFIMC